MKPWRRNIAVEGLNLERFLRTAGEADVILTNLRRISRKRMTALVQEDDIQRLEDIVCRGGWKMTVLSPLGLGRILRCVSKKRMLVIWLTLAFCMLLLSTMFIWKVEVCGAGVYEADLRTYLEAMDVRAFRCRKSIDVGKLKDALEWRYPDIAWFECAWRGMTLVVTVHEGIAQGDTVTIEGSGDVIAARDGVIDSVITLAGTPAVKRGDVVRKGDVLIIGQERTSQEGLRPVSARGKVFARVWDGAVVQMPAMQVETVWTGRTQQSASVRLPWFELWHNAPSDFEMEDVSVHTTPLGGMFIPFVYVSETRMEVKIHNEMRDPDQVRAEAGVAAMRKLSEKVGHSDIFLTKWVDYSMIDDEVLCAVAIGERVIDIAESSPHHAVP